MVADNQCGRHQGKQLGRVLINGGCPLLGEFVLQRKMQAWRYALGCRGHHVAQIANKLKV